LALGFAVGAREEDAGLRAGRAHDDPALRTPVVGLGRRIFDEIEPEHADEEGDRGVVLRNDDCHELELGHGARILSEPGASSPRWNGSTTRCQSARVATAIWPRTDSPPTITGDRGSS